MLESQNLHRGFASGCCDSHCIEGTAMKGRPPVTTDFSVFLSQYSGWEKCLTALHEYCVSLGLKFHQQNTPHQARWSLGQNSDGTMYGQTAGATLKKLSNMIDVQMLCPANRPWPGMAIWPGNDKGRYCHLAAMLPRDCTAIPDEVKNAIKSAVSEARK